MTANRRFALLTALLLLVAAGGLSWFVDRMTTNQALRLAEQQNVGLARTLASTLRREVRQLINDAQTLDAQSLRSDPRVVSFRTALRVHLINLPIAKIKIYDARGMTVFSSELAQIGSDASKNAGFRAAIAGGIATEMTFRYNFSAFDDVVVDRNLLSSYVPVEDFAGRVDSVFEIYQDITDLLNALSRATRLYTLAIFGAFALVYAALLLLRRRG